MKKPISKNRGNRHHWICAGLLKRGYTLEVANVIATRYVFGGTLFPNERADAIAVDRIHFGKNLVEIKNAVREELPSPRQ